jgi:hypothetical protein
MNMLCSFAHFLESKDPKFQAVSARSDITLAQFVGSSACKEFRATEASRHAQINDNWSNEPDGGEEEMAVVKESASS